MTTPTEQTAETPLRVLLVEDNAADAELMLHELHKAHFVFQANRVETEKDFLTQLHMGVDLILADYHLPRFSGAQALNLLRKSGLDVPFIVVSGSIGEDIAVDAMKKGADDYLLKDRMAKLGQAVRRVLKDKALRDQLRKASESLRQSEEKYRAIFENSSVGIFRETPEGRFLEANPALARMLGYDSVESLKAHTSADLFAQPDERGPLLRELTIKGFLTNREIHLCRKDGATLIGLLTAKTVRNEAGNVQWIDAVIQDITEWAAMQRETLRLKRQLEFLLGVTKTGLDIIDGDFNIRYIDPAWQRVYGHPTGRKCYEYFMGRSEPCPNCGVPKALQTRQVAVTEETLLRENSRPVQVTTIPFQDESGEWLVAEVNVDLTERKHMEARLQQAQKLESIGRLAAGIAHEINTPIQFLGDNYRFLQDAINGLWKPLDALPGLLEEARNNALREETLQRMDRLLSEADLPYCAREIPLALEQSGEGIQRITRIVRAMKEFAHPSSDEMVLTDINKAVDTTVTVARNEWKYAAEVHTELDPNLPPIECHPGEINQVLLNLIVNAAHAITERFGNSGQVGEIRISTRSLDDSIEVRIADNGIGIAPEHQAHVFELFFTTKGVGKGTGQGLAMAYHTVAVKHKGTITFETEPGAGATFVIRLPVKSPVNSEPRSEDSSA